MRLVMEMMTDMALLKMAAITLYECLSTTMNDTNRR